MFLVSLPAAARCRRSNQKIGVLQQEDGVQCPVSVTLMPLPRSKTKHWTVQTTGFSEFPPDSALFSAVGPARRRRCPGEPSCTACRDRAGRRGRRTAGTRPASSSSTTSRRSRASGRLLKTTFGERWVSLSLLFSLVEVSWQNCGNDTQFMIHYNPHVVVNHSQLSLIIIHSLSFL